MSILGWILFGLVVGVVGKLLMPGRDPGGFVLTILLGIAGALIGGFVGQSLGFYQPGEPAGFVMAVIGSIYTASALSNVCRKTRLTTIGYGPPRASEDQSFHWRDAPRSKYISSIRRANQRREAAHSSNPGKLRSACHQTGNEHRDVKSRSSA